MSDIEAASPVSYNTDDDLDNDTSFEDELYATDDEAESDDEATKRAGPPQPVYEKQLKGFVKNVNLIANYIVEYNNSLDARKVSPALKPGFLQKFYKSKFRNCFNYYRLFFLNIFFSFSP